MIHDDKYIYIYIYTHYNDYPLNLQLDNNDSIFKYKTIIFWIIMDLINSKIIKHKQPLDQNMFPSFKNK